MIIYKLLLIIWLPISGLLPELKTNASMEMRRAIIPAVQQDFIPDELLLALTEPPPVSDPLGPPGRHRNLAVTNVSTVP